MKRNFILFFIVFIFVIGCAVLAGQVYKTHFKANETMVSAYDSADTTLVIEGEEILEEHPPVVSDGQILLPYQAVKTHLDPYIWWDETLKKVTVTTADRVIQMETDKLDAYINNTPMELKFPATEISGVLYVPVDFLASFYRIKLQYISTTNVVIIDREDTIFRTGYPISAGSVVRKGRHIRYPILKRFADQELQAEASKMFVFEEYDKWYKVRTTDGILGYISKEDLVVKSYELGLAPQSIKSSPPLPSGKINLVWDQMYNPTKAYLSWKIEEGIDVLSPTWFQIANDRGDFINRADSVYVQWAHDNGYQVWALVANEFSNIANTSTILNDGLKREYVIKQLLAFAALYQLDGLNIDFENIYKTDKEVYTQFIREFTPLAREQGLTVSVDVTVPDGSDTWSRCYDRKALAETVDYVCLMTYDQTWAGSSKSGSTAELDWVEENLKKTLKEVPADKLLMGIPLYTRLWEETTDANGKTTAKTGKALTMQAANSLMEKNNVQPQWDERSGQYSVSFTDGGVTYKMWLENEHSVNYKSALAHKYNLAGTSAWSYNFANEKVWAVFAENLKNTVHYEEWKTKNAKNP
ncbi:MAG: glycoside hydrolase [Thermoclostridium sp.]|nr:glycoside hydrolase [Thermoclostridium sp.]